MVISRVATREITEANPAFLRACGFTRDEVIAWMDAMVESGARGSLTAAAVNLVMSSRDDDATMRAVLGTTLAVPDGQPLVWALRLLGNNGSSRQDSSQRILHAAGDFPGVHLAQQAERSQ